MPRRRGAAIVALVLAALCAARLDAAAQDEASARALGRWADAVLHHRPGSPDASAAFTASLTLAQRAELNPADDATLAACAARSSFPPIPGGAIVWVPAATPPR